MFLKIFSFYQTPLWFYRHLNLLSEHWPDSESLLSAGYQLQYYNNDNNDFAKRSVNRVSSEGMKLVESGKITKEAFTFTILRGK